METMRKGVRSRGGEEVRGRRERDGGEVAVEDTSVVDWCWVLVSSLYFLIHFLLGVFAS
jgi:hypothetical protein